MENKFGQDLEGTIMIWTAKSKQRQSRCLVFSIRSADGRFREEKSHIFVIYASKLEYALLWELGRRNSKTTSSFTFVTNWPFDLWHFECKLCLPWSPAPYIYIYIKSVTDIRNNIITVLFFFFCFLREIDRRAQRWAGNLASMGLRKRCIEWFGRKTWGKEMTWKT